MAEEQQQERRVPRVSWETRIALLEQRQDQHEKRQDQQDQKMVDLANKVDERFDKLELHIVELKNKNPIMDFLREKWQAVLFILVILLGQPSVEVIKVLAHILGVGK